VAPDHPCLRVYKRIGRALKTRKSYVLYGMTPGERYLAFNNSITASERALKERLFFVEIDGKWVEPYDAPYALVEKKMRRFTEALCSKSTRKHPLGYQQFCDGYKGPKRARYLKAAESLARKPIERKDSDCKFFIKYECYDFSKKYHAPRGINPPSDRYLVEFGTYINRIEKLIYKNVEEVFGYKVILKGLNQQQRGRLISSYWDEFTDPVAICIDASRMEQSVSTGWLEWEGSVYQSFFGNDSKLRKLMKWQLSNKGYCFTNDGCIVFTKTGKRCSGFNNTGLGNSIITAACAYEYMIRISVLKYRFFCDGDDGTIIIERGDLARFRECYQPWFSELGFRMKTSEPIYILEHIEFCQSRPVWTEDGYLMVRCPRRALNKDSFSKKPLDGVKVFRRWIKAVGQGGISTTGGIPIMQAFYAKLDTVAGDIKPLTNDPTQSKYNEYKIFGMKRTLTEIPERVRASFCLAFGISPAAQMEIEQYYQNLDFGFVSERHPSLCLHGNLPW
jgi:hypothetical protein